MIATVSRALGSASVGFLFVIVPSCTAQSIPIDRWLMSSAFPADTIQDPLARDHLAAGGEGFILPDRGTEIGGAAWRLVRNDGSTSFAVPSDMEGAAIVYANSYVRTPADQTVRVRWHVSACARMALLVNGRRVASDALFSDPESDPWTGSAWVRLGFGWNTILAKIETGCETTFGVQLEEGWAEKDVAPWPEGVSLQASLPAGDIRVRPSAWILMSREIGPLPSLAWRHADLSGTLRLQFSEWGIAIPDSVEVRARVEGDQAEYRLDPGPPSSPTEIVFDVEFPNLRKAGTKRGAARFELRWPDEKLELELDVPASRVLQAFHGPIRLDGWGPGPDDPGPATDDGDLPSTGRVLRGSWVIPDALDGFTLQLDVAGAPGEFKLELDPLPTPEGTAPLCSPCRKGTPVDLFVTVTEDWTAWPSARVLDPGYPTRDDPDDPAAAGWLQMLDDRGSERYRQRGIEAASP